MTAVSDAESTYNMNSADEDCLTGALGQSLAMPRKEVFSLDNGEISVNISHTKLRGRGKNAPEKTYGSDGIFQIEILDHFGRLIMAKGLPFQSKKNWNGTLSKLKKQAVDMERNTPGGIIIDFSDRGYGACMATDVIASGGSKSSVIGSKKMHKLGDLLGNEFLNCTIGTRNLHFDTHHEKYHVKGDGFHLITTSIEID